MKLYFQTKNAQNVFVVKVKEERITPTYFSGKNTLKTKSSFFFQTK